MNKKQISIVIFFTVFVSVLTSCAIKSGSANISTTAETDSNGTTHYYAPVADDNDNITTNKEQGLFAEIETDASRKAVTKKDGTYVTNENTTFLALKNMEKDKNTTVKKNDSTTKKPSANNKNTDADNVIPFETSRHNNATTTNEKKKSSTTTAESTDFTDRTTQSATDEDGWINKWY